MPQPHASSRETQQYQASIWVPVQHLLRKWLMGAMCFDSLAGGRQTLWWLTQVSQTHPSHAHHTYLTWKRLLHIHASNGSRYAQKYVSLASDFTHCAEPSAPLRHWNYTLWLCPHGSSFPRKSGVAAIWLKLFKLNRGFPWFVSIVFARHDLHLLLVELGFVLDVLHIPWSKMHKHQTRILAILTRLGNPPICA